MRECIFDQHRQGTICHAKHVQARLKDTCGLEVHERTVQRHLSRRGFCGLRTKNRPRSLRPSAQRYHVVYVDASFLHHHHGGQSAWFSAHDVVERMRGTGRRGCCMHAMQANALIAGALLACAAQHGTGDDHAQCDGDMLQHGFTAQ